MASADLRWYWMGLGVTVTLLQLLQLGSDSHERTPTIKQKNKKIKQIKGFNLPITLEKLS